MATELDIEFHRGEPWMISFVAHEADGVTIMPLLSGVEVEFRVSDLDQVLFTKNVGDGIFIVDGPNGAADINISEADQDQYHLGFTEPLFYSIRVTSGDSVSIQAEGRIKVADSLYEEPLDPLLQEFRVRCPEIDVDDQVVSLYLGDAARYVDGLNAFAAADRSVAIVYYAAHLLQLKLNAKKNYEAGGGATGQVRMVRVEDRTVSFGDTTAGIGKVGTLASTVYGQLFNAIRRITGATTEWLMRA